MAQIKEHIIAFRVSELTKDGAAGALPIDLSEVEAVIQELAGNRYIVEVVENIE